MEERARMYMREASISSTYTGNEHLYLPAKYMYCVKNSDPAM